MERPAVGSLPAPAMESLGFVFSETMQRSISALDLFQLQEALAKEMLILGSGVPEEYDKLGQHFTALGSNCEVRDVEAPKVWLREERLDNALVPYQSIKTIIDWFSSK